MSRGTPDYRLLGAFLVLLTFGVLVLASASAVVGFERFSDAYYFLKRQLVFGVLPGLVIFFILLRHDYRRLKPLAAPIFALALLLLILVLIPGIGTSFGGARRWLVVGPFSFQPSEFMKLGLVIYLAAWLSRRPRQLTEGRQGLLPFAFILGSAVGLIVLQPDIGTATAVGLIGMGMYLVAGAPWRYLLILSAAGLLLFFVLVTVKPHAAERFTTFLHPELDPQGVGYHINQAYMAIGSGGWFGRGIGQSRAKFQYLPEVYGDSIFAVIGEELGFVFSVTFIGLLMFIFYYGIKAARAAPDDFGRLLAGGVVIWFTSQTFVNISAMLGLLPLTGIPLPFVSYGSSALLMTLAGAGLLVAVSSQARAA